MNLRGLVDRYLAVAGGYGGFVALGSLGFPQDETERILGIFDEDYNISRFLSFQNHSGESFSINGFPQTHISIDAGIQSIL